MHKAKSIRPMGNRTRKGQAPLASNIRAWRLYRGLTQVALAKRLGLTVGAVHNIETGHSDFTGKTLIALSVALETTPSGLLAPPNDRADIWSVWDDLREQGQTRQAEAVLRALRDSAKNG